MLLKHTLPTPTPARAEIPAHGQARTYTCTHARTREYTHTALLTSSLLEAVRPSFFPAVLSRLAGCSPAGFVSIRIMSGRAYVHAAHVLQGLSLWGFSSAGHFVRQGFWSRLLLSDRAFCPAGFFSGRFFVRQGFFVLQGFCPAAFLSGRFFPGRASVLRRIGKHTVKQTHRLIVDPPIDRYKDKLINAYIKLNIYAGI